METYWNIKAKDIAFGKYRKSKLHGVSFFNTKTTKKSLAFCFIGVSVSLWDSKYKSFSDPGRRRPRRPPPSGGGTRGDRPGGRPEGAAAGTPTSREQRAWGGVVLGGGGF